MTSERHPAAAVDFVLCNEQRPQPAARGVHTCSVICVYFQAAHAGDYHVQGAWSLGFAVICCCWAAGLVPFTCKVPPSDATVRHTDAAVLWRQCQCQPIDPMCLGCTPVLCWVEGLCLLRARTCMCVCAHNPVSGCRKPVDKHLPHHAMHRDTALWFRLVSACCFVVSLFAHTCRRCIRCMICSTWLLRDHTAYKSWNDCAEEADYLVAE